MSAKSGFDELNTSFLSPKYHCCMYQVERRWSVSEKSVTSPFPDASAGRTMPFWLPLYLMPFAFRA